MKTIVFLLTVLLILVSCEEIIEVDLIDESNNRLIVEGGITNEPGKSHQILLKESKAYYDTSKTPLVTDAIVSISEGKNNYMLTETEPGVYTTDPGEFIAEEGRTYNLNIELPNGEQYKATEYLKPVVEMDSIRYKYEADPFGFDNYYKIMYYGPEPEGYGDHYMWDLYINDTLDTDSLWEIQIVDDEFVDGNYIFDFELFWIDEFKLKQDTNQIKIVTSSISKKFFDFWLETMYQTEFRGGMFDTPPTNVKSTNIFPVNHDKPAFGYFRASAVESYEILIVKEE